MKFKIWHAENVRDSFFYSKDGKIWNQRQVLNSMKNWEYKMVGEIEISHVSNENVEDSLDMVYNYSQNIEDHWNKNKPCRSTSVGDVIETENESLYVVASYGFDKLEI